MKGGRRSTLNGFSSQREKMAWVRSFIKKKRGSGYKKKHKKKKKRYGKGMLYRHYTLSNPLKFKKSHRRHRRRGRGYYRGGNGLVDSGWYGIGDPDNPSGWFRP